MPPAPSGTLTRKERKAAKYAFQRAMKATARAASSGEPPAPAATLSQA
jgi:hypothetical protein